MWYHYTRVQIRKKDPRHNSQTIPQGFVTSNDCFQIADLESSSLLGAENVVVQRAKWRTVCKAITIEKMRRFSTFVLAWFIVSENFVSQDKLHWYRALQSDKCCVSLTLQTVCHAIISCSQIPMRRSFCLFVPERKTDDKLESKSEWKMSKQLFYSDEDLLVRNFEKLEPDSVHFCQNP